MENKPLVINFDINFLKEYRDFQKTFDTQEFSEYYSAEGDESSITDEEYKVLKFISGILPKLINFEEGVIYIKDVARERELPRICCGGTCGQGVCCHIGRMTQCDSGCMYG